jgi:hypothetical protein
MDTLNKYKNKPLYEVPEHFFEKFQHEIMQRVTKERKQRKKYKQLVYAISVAASIALIIALSYFIFLNRDTNNHFYAHKELSPIEDSITSLDFNHLTEVVELDDSIPLKEIIHNKSIAINETSAETIAYRAVDYYVDDYETETFFDTLYELECYYDY